MAHHGATFSLDRGIQNLKGHPLAHPEAAARVEFREMGPVSPSLLSE